jgi:hypothetical protein
LAMRKTVLLPCNVFKLVQALLGRCGLLAKPRLCLHVKSRMMKRIRAKSLQHGHSTGLAVQGHRSVIVV